MGTGTAPWKQLLLASLGCNSHLKHSSYFQLATVGTNGRPSNRTVVFRGFQEGSDKIQIYTDSRSGKIEELQISPFAEICWYFTESWEQFRISGRVDIIDSSITDALKLEQRDRAWSSISQRSRQQYMEPSPGLPYLSEQSSMESSRDSSTGPVDAFCLLTLHPDQVDYLNLKVNQRLVFKSQPSCGEEIVWISERDSPYHLNNGYLLEEYSCYRRSNYADDIKTKSKSRMPKYTRFSRCSHRQPAFATPRVSPNTKFMRFNLAECHLYLRYCLDIML